jgi:hypothetical protein
MANFVFIDSAGRTHRLVFRGARAVVSDASAGMGKFRYTGELKGIAEACGFSVEEDGEEQIPPDKATCNQKKQEELSNRERNQFFHRAKYRQLADKGIDAEVKKFPGCTYHWIQVDTNRVDWVVLMAFMDNHSGDLHGTGHAGAFIVDGSSNLGRYVDFGTYHAIYKDFSIDNGTGENLDPFQSRPGALKSFARVRVSDKFSVNIIAGSRLDDIKFGKIWQECNRRFGSMLFSDKKCLRTGFQGPEHQHEFEADNESAHKISPQNFRINGIIAWAAFRLKRGAYIAMERYALACKAFVDGQFEIFKKSYRKNDDPASLPNGVDDHGINYLTTIPDPYRPFSFNCMTWALNVYSQGLRPDVPYKTNLMQSYPNSWGRIDHPNAHIKQYMAMADDKGYFDDRWFQGEVEAVSGKQRYPAKKPRIRHHEKIGTTP